MLPLMLIHPTCNVGIQADAKLPGLLIAQALPFVQPSSNSVPQRTLFAAGPSERVAPWSAPGGAWIRTWILHEILIKVISRQVTDSEDPQ